MMHLFNQPALRWGFLSLLLGIPWCILLLLPSKSLEDWFVHGAYWILTTYLLGAVGTIILVFQRHRSYWISWWQRNKQRLGWSILVGFVLTLMIFAVNPFFYKTLSDETNLLSVSRSLLIEKRAFNITEGLYYYNNFQPLKYGLPKRPLLHPYLVQLIHLSTGYRWQNPFVLNALILWGLLGSVCLVFTRWRGHTIGLAAALVVASSPMLGIYTVSAGFDLLSLAMMWWSAVWLFTAGWCTRPTASTEQQHLAFPLATLGMWTAIGFVQVRHENLALFLGGLLAFSVLRYSQIMPWLRNSWRQLSSPIALLLVLGNLMWLLALALRLINVDRMTESTDEALLSFEHLLAHLPILGVSLFGGPWTGDVSLLPYRSLLWYLLLALLCWGAFDVWKRWSGWKPTLLTWLRHGLRGHLHPTQAIGLALFAIFVVQLGIYLAHYYGLPNHPTQARFFLPLTFWASLLFCWSWISILHKSKQRSLIVVALLLWVFYFPQGQQERFINKLTLNRETRHIYQVVLNDPQNNVLYIHERPGQIVVLERGAISVRRASQELGKYQKNLSQGLIQELVYLRRTDTDPAQDQQLLDNGDWLEEQRFMITTRRELVVLRHRKTKEPD